MIEMFLNEPLWFKTLISITLLASIILSSSFFSDHLYLRSGSKLAAAIFFCAYAIKFRMNFKTAFLFYVCSAICVSLAMWSLF
ncbi:hypothetical protein [Planococcus shixiaomingii]|uniref:hypothetical protein n=1 Tax=Planococcus shixiaomingii TaxID=3058393 RepID=UPI00265882AB|nr:hypothetical protein [Planococcus sp. N028]